MGHLASLAMVMVIDRLMIERTAGKCTMYYLDLWVIMCYIEAEGEIDCTGWCVMEGVQTRNGLYGFDFRDVDLRRVDPSERKRYEIKQLWQRSHEIINLTARGFKEVEVAEILGITPACVSMTLNSELGQKKLSDIRFSRDEEAKKTSEKIRILTAKALQVYHEIFDNEDGQASLKDQKDTADTVVLELSGLRAPTRIQTSSVSTILTADEIKAFKERGRKAAEEVGLVIDVTPTNGGEDDLVPSPITNPPSPIMSEVTG